MKAALQSRLSLPPDASTRAAPRLWGNGLPHPLTIWLVLVIALCFPVLVWYISSLHFKQQASERFHYNTELVRQAIGKRMLDYEQVLRGAVGLFNASPAVTRQAWRTYFTTLQLEKYYPGFLGLAFAQWIRPVDKDEVIAQVRREGYPGFDITPPGDRPEYTAIVYIEPLQELNHRALGFDMWSDSVRHAAMARARDTGQPALSGRVTLVQEPDTARQPGILLYMPVYRLGQPLETVAQRRDALLGFVYSPFRMYDLMRGILRENDLHIGLHLFDGTEMHAEALLFDSEVERLGFPAKAQPMFTQTHTIELAGRVWTLHYYARPGFDAMTGRLQSLLNAGVSLGVDGLLFYVIWLLSVGRRREVGLAERMTAELRESEERFRLVVEAAPNALIMVDEAGCIRLANAQAETLFGYPRTELLGLHIERLIPERFRLAHMTYRMQFFAAPQTRAMGVGRDLYGLRKDGQEVPIEIGLNPLTTPAGHFVLASIVDITERKQSEERFRLVVETVPNALIMVDEAGCIRLANAQVEMLFGYPLEELLGQHIERLIPERFRLAHMTYRMQFFAAPQTRAMGVGRDLYGLRKDGQEVPIEIGLNPLTTPAGQFVLASIVDITERKQAEEELKASLAEKEMLLKEIHHRVKNNMQVISSLLQLQRGYIEDARYQGVFEECQHRVRSMALVHEQLYRSSNLATIDFGAYIGDLATMLVRSYSSENVRLQIDVEAVSLDLDTAIPLGLILNEIVSNALKHAFPDGRAGQLTVRLSHQGQDMLYLTARDNGIGLPEGLDWDTARSLGLRLMRTLARQIRGTITVQNNAGTAITILFPVPGRSASESQAT